MENAKQDLPVTFREATDADVPFITSSWLHSFRSSPFARFLSKDLYFNQHHKVLEQIFARGAVAVIACDPSDSSHIYGYVVCEPGEAPPVVHYVYVKHAFRRFGLGKALLAAAVRPELAWVYSHETNSSYKLRAKLANGFYSPYTAFIGGK